MKAVSRPVLARVKYSLNDSLTAALRWLESSSEVRSTFGPTLTLGPQLKGHIEHQNYEPSMGGQI